eukprot:jgi/Tetstr1/429489/TSEL_019396.t1
MSSPPPPPMPESVKENQSASAINRQPPPGLGTQASKPAHGGPPPSTNPSLAAGVRVSGSGERPHAGSPQRSGEKRTASGERKPRPLSGDEFCVYEDPPNDSSGTATPCTSDSDAGLGASPSGPRRPGRSSSRPPLSPLEPHPHRRGGGQACRLPRRQLDDPETKKAILQPLSDERALFLDAATTDLGYITIEEEDGPGTVVGEQPRLAGATSSAAARAVPLEEFEVYCDDDECQGVPVETPSCSDHPSARSSDEEAASDN